MPVRRCPVCNRPFPPHGPCPFCPAQTAPAPATTTPVNPTKSASALRGDKFRAKQKAANPDFNKGEAKRRKEQRFDRKNAEELKRLLESGQFSKQFPKNLDLLRSRTGLGLMMVKAPQGLGKIVLGNSAIALSENFQAQNDQYAAPSWAQLSDKEIRDNLKLPTDTNSKIDILEFVMEDPVDDLSIDEIDELFKKLFKNLDWIRELLYPEDKAELPLYPKSSLQPFMDRGIKRHGHLPTMGDQEEQKPNRELEAPRRGTFTSIRRMSCR
jgi:hypothetical protein